MPERTENTVPAAPETIEARAFARQRPEPGKLTAFGFVRTDGGYRYETLLMDGAFRAELAVSDVGTVTGRVVDPVTEEEYLPLRITLQTGGYAYEVRNAYETLLAEIAARCCTALPFVSAQANRLTERIRLEFGEQPDFPWAAEPNADSGVFRAAGGRRWYGLIMRIDAAKLDKTEASAPPKQIDVLNVKIREADGPALRRETGIYPAWHMNHRTWISVRLDDTLPDDRVFALIRQSRALLGNPNAGARDADGRKNWIIPANPKYYDVVTVFDANDVTYWKQGRGIEVGDIVYMYVAVPYSAILYKCEVLRTHIPREREEDRGPRELMEVRVLERYGKEGEFGLKTVLPRFGVRTVRGPRFMPQALIGYIEAETKREEEAE